MAQRRSTYGPQDRSLRAADADRERIADALRGHHLDGRIDAAEYEQRLEACYRARTYAELDGLVADLPGPGRPLAPSPPRRRLVTPPALMLLAIVAVLVVAAAAGAHAFWVFIPAWFVLARRGRCRPRIMGPRRYL